MWPFFTSPQASVFVFPSVRLQVVTAYGVPPIYGLSAPSTMRRVRITHRPRLHVVRALSGVPTCCSEQLTASKAATTRTACALFVDLPPAGRLLDCHLFPAANCQTPYTFRIVDQHADIHTYIFTQLYIKTNKCVCGTVGRLAVMRAAFTLRVAYKSISMDFFSFTFYSFYCFLKPLALCPLFKCVYLLYIYINAVMQCICT